MSDPLAQVRAAVQSAWSNEREATYAMNSAAAAALRAGATREELVGWTGATPEHVDHWIRLAPAFDQIHADDLERGRG